MPASCQTRASSRSPATAFLRLPDAVSLMLQRERAFSMLTRHRKTSGNTNSTNSTTSPVIRQVMGTAKTQVDTELGHAYSAVTYTLLARTCPRALFIASPSCFDNVPSSRIISALSRVKGLKRTLQGTLRPACRQP